MNKTERNAAAHATDRAAHTVPVTVDVTSRERHARGSSRTEDGRHISPNVGEYDATAYTGDPGR